METKLKSSKDMRMICIPKNVLDWWYLGRCLLAFTIEMGLLVVRLDEMAFRRTIGGY